MVFDYGGGDEAALVALRPIAVGECFSVAPSDSEDDGEDSDSVVDQYSEDEDDEEEVSE